LVWNAWPWINQAILDTKNFNNFQKSLISISTFFLDFKYKINIQDVIKHKLEALMEYKTQITKYNDISDWPTLYDIYNGDFLKCFFNGYEIFS